LQDTPLCSFIATTNLDTLTGYDEWGCSAGGFTTTDPWTGGGEWAGVSCTNNFVTAIAMDGVGLTGMY